MIEQWKEQRSTEIETNHLLYKFHKAAFRGGREGHSPSLAESLPPLEIFRLRCAIGTSLELHPLDTLGYLNSCFAPP